MTVLRKLAPFLILLAIALAVVVVMSFRSDPSADGVEPSRVPPAADATVTAS